MQLEKSVSTEHIKLIKSGGIREATKLKHVSFFNLALKLTTLKKQIHEEHI